MRELRITENIELRTAHSGRSIEGYAAVFGQRSENLGGFKETIRPGAFARAIRERQDVRALFNHDPKQLLGRTRSGTLRLSEDGTGLRFQVDMPDTTLGRDVYTLVKRGDISQCSFGFTCARDSWNAAGDRRELLDVDLSDISPVTFPAYQGTSVAARSLPGELERRGRYVFSRPHGLYLQDSERNPVLEGERRRLRAEIMDLEIHLERNGA